MSRNIILCYDGTCREYQKDNTNVVRTFEVIERDDSQIAFYDPGVGTLNIFGRYFASWLGVLISKILGYGIRQNIEEGYEYLMDNFHTGDRVFIFGFSRGAYTACLLAKMINQFGILERGRKNLMPYVSKMFFKKDKRREISNIEGFRKAFSNVCKPHFVGLWDMVGTLGPFLSKKIPELKLDFGAKNIFHAISIDEKRVLRKMILLDENHKTSEQIIEQVWFPGIHSEVGGGCSKNNCSLQDIALVWMLDKSSQYGLRLKDGWSNNFYQDAVVDIHDSYNFFQQVIPGLLKKRAIPEGAKIHQSVMDRISKRTDYNPILPMNIGIASTDSYAYARITEGQKTTHQPVIQAPQIIIEEVMN